MQTVAMKVVKIALLWNHFNWALLTDSFIRDFDPIFRWTHVKDGIDMFAKRCVIWTIYIMFLQQITSRFGHAALKFLIFLLQGISSNRYNDDSSIHCKKVFLKNSYTISIANYIFLTTQFKWNHSRVYCDV